MDKLAIVGRIFFAIALIGLGIEHFVFGEFVTGRAPAWPASTPGGPAWAYLTGIVVVAVGTAILAGKKARFAAVLVGLLIFVWALLRQIPVVAADSFLAPTWTRAGKALTLSGGALAIAASLPAVANRYNALWRFVNLRDEFTIAGRFSLGIFMIICGVQHFMYTKFVAMLIPGWFPGAAVFWTYFAGVALIAGGIGLFVPRTARLAALLSGLMVFSWFWIVHLPRTLTSVSDSISIFEALAVAGIAFVLAASSSRKGLANDRRVKTEPHGPAMSLLLILGIAALTACGDAETSDREGDVATSAQTQRSPGGYAASVHRDTAAVRRATRGFHELDSAVAAGYPRSVPNCLSHPDLGGMGHNHINRDLLDDHLAVERPEILLYSYAPDGEYVFNGVEYIVPYTSRPPDARPPTIMGQQLKRSDALELWYLHAWVWTENPAGLFADWNPRVECRA